MADLRYILFASILTVNVCMYGMCVCVCALCALEGSRDPEKGIFRGLIAAFSVWCCPQKDSRGQKENN